MEKDRKKAEKAKKFAEKKAKQTETAPASASKGKKSKPDSTREENLPDYVEETPFGEKKST